MIHYFVRKQSLTVLVLAVLLGCKTGTKEETKSADSLAQVKHKADSLSAQRKKEEEAVDTAHYFIKSLLNQSPQAVAAILGKPDGAIQPATSCVYLPNCTEATYRNKKYGVHYYKNALKSIIIAEYPVFNKHVIEFLGFPDWPPSVANVSIIEWKGRMNKAKTSSGPLIPVPGIITIAVTPPYAESKGVVIIQVEADFDNKF